MSGTYPILIVEDDLFFREHLQRILLPSGHEVTVVENGRRALEVLSERFFPIVITDWLMPELDGLELCRSIRSLSLKDYVFILLLTARSSTEDIVTGLAAGADDYLCKPFNPPELMARLETGLRVLARERTLKETRDMLLQSEKLAAIGQLAAGVGHEILNPTNIISLRLQLLETTEALTPKARDVLEICRRQLDRIVEITRNLGRFSRHGTHGMRPGDVNRLVERVLALCAPKFKVEDIELVGEYCPDLPPVPLDGDRMEQVLLNLLANAAAAVAGASERRVRVAVAPSTGPGGVRICVCDSGPGIPDENLGRIFEPYFSTKPPGEGTGLGLFICYNIIREHGGRVWAEAGPGRGACFYIELPGRAPAHESPAG